MMAMYRWTRWTTLDQEDEWTEKLEFLPPGSWLMLTAPGSSRLTIRAFGDKEVADRLVRDFGGKAEEIDPDSLSSAPAPATKPLSIRGKWWVFSDEAAYAASQRPAIFIPHGMAFGTGDHATTASCLRFLCDLVPELPSPWTLLDAGTGSGILAIAAEKMGAARVEAFDFDPVCVRVTTENLQKNACQRVRVIEADVRDLRDFATADVVTANLFSELLMESAPGLREKLREGGVLIFSGILRTQIAEVCECLVRTGFTEPTTVQRGKWCAGITRRVG